MLVFHLIKTSKGAWWALNFMRDLKSKYPNLSFAVAIPKGGSLYDEYYDICEHVFDIDFTIGPKSISSGLKLRRAVKEVNPDIIHSWFTQTTLFARIFLRDLKIPRIFQVVGPAHLEYKIFKFLDIKSANSLDFWVATSKYIKNIYEENGVSSDRTYLNYAYTDIDLLAKKKEIGVPINYHERYNLNSNTKIVGTASFIYSPKLFQNTGIKAHEDLLLSFSKLLELRDDVILIIAGESFTGDEEYINKLKLKAQALCGDKVIFTGKYTNVYHVIANFDVFVYLSKMENLGGVFESLLFEIPTVASKSGGLPELVKHNETGFTVKYNDHNRVAYYINKLIVENGIAQSFRRNGNELVKKTFDKTEILETGMKIYQSLTVQ